MKTTNPGKRDRLVTLYRCNRVTNARSGQSEAVYEVECQAWASVRTLTSAEVARNKTAGVETSVELNIRYRTDLTTEWRVGLPSPRGMRLMDIVGIVDVDDRHREFVVRCLERTT